MSTSLDARFGTQPVVAPAAQDIIQHDARHIAIDSTRTTARVTSAAALADAVGLGWTASKAPLALAADGRSITSHVAVTRSDTGAVIGVVGADYGIIQPADMAELADAILGESGGEYAPGNAGVLRGGSRAFLQVRGPVRRIDGIAEAAQSNVSIFNSWDGSLRFEAGFADTIIVCRNTLRAALDEASNGITIRHSASAPERVKQAKRIIAAARAYTGALDNHLLAMLGRPLSTDQLMGLLQELIPERTAKGETARQAILSAYSHAPGAAPGSAWGALQAVTYYTTHSYPVRQTSGRTAAQARSESNWFGPGAALARAAWKRLDTDASVQALQYVRQL